VRMLRRHGEGLYECLRVGASASTEERPAALTATGNTPAGCLELNFPTLDMYILASLERNGAIMMVCIMAV
jgi:hypothetical protein